MTLYDFYKKMLTTNEKFTNQRISEKENLYGDDFYPSEEYKKLENSCADMYITFSWMITRHSLTPKLLCESLNKYYGGDWRCSMTTPKKTKFYDEEHDYIFDKTDIKVIFYNMSQDKETLEKVCKKTFKNTSGKNLFLSNHAVVLFSRLETSPNLFKEEILERNWIDVIFGLGAEDDCEIDEVGTSILSKAATEWMKTININQDLIDIRCEKEAKKEDRNKILYFKDAQKSNREK